MMVCWPLLVSSPTTRLTDGNYFLAKHTQLFSEIVTQLFSETVTQLFSEMVTQLCSEKGHNYFLMWLHNYFLKWWLTQTIFWNGETRQLSIFWNGNTTIFWNGDMCRMRWGEVLLHWTGILSTLLGRRHSFRLLLDYTLWSFFTAALNLECVLGRICKLFDSRLGIKYGHLGKLRR